MAIAEPEQGESGTREAAARVSAASHTRFDQIVQPHPLVAFLFRRRTFLVLLGLLAMVPYAQPRPAMLTTGIVIYVLAEALRIWAAGTIHKSQEVTTGGPYAYVRHPLYVGSFFHTVAFCFMSGRWGSFLFAVPLFLLLYSAAVGTEEVMLVKLFGTDYVEYARRVPRFVPRLRRAEAGRGQFSWRQVMWNKEYTNIVWGVVLGSLFILRAYYHVL